MFFLGLLSWALPFLLAIPALVAIPSRGAVPGPLAQSVLSVASSGTAIWVLAFALRKAQHTLASGLAIGLIWLALHLIIDLVGLLVIGLTAFLAYLYYRVPALTPKSLLFGLLAAVLPLVFALTVGHLGQAPLAASPFGVLTGGAVAWLSVRVLRRASPFVASAVFIALFWLFSQVLYDYFLDWRPMGLPSLWLYFQHAGGQWLLLPIFGAVLGAHMQWQRAQASRSATYGKIEP